MSQPDDAPPSAPSTVAAGDRDGWGELHSKQISWYMPDRHRSELGVSGVEYLQSVIDGRYPPPPIAAVAGIELVSVSVGELVLRCAPDESWLNPHAVIHGGLLCTLMDSAMGMSVISTLESLASAYTTIELKVSFLRPLPWDGRSVEVRGTTLRAGRKVAFAEAHAHDADGRLVGHATSSLAAVD